MHAAALFQWAMDRLAQVVSLGESVGLSTLEYAAARGTLAGDWADTRTDADRAAVADNAQAWANHATRAYAAAGGAQLGPALAPPVTKVANGAKMIGLLAAAYGLWRWLR